MDVGFKLNYKYNECDNAKRLRPDKQFVTYKSVHINNNKNIIC